MATTGHSVDCATTDRHVVATMEGQQSPQARHAQQGGGRKMQSLSDSDGADDEPLLAMTAQTRKPSKRRLRLHRHEYDVPEAEDGEGTDLLDALHKRTCAMVRQSAETLREDRSSGSDSDSSTGSEHRTHTSRRQRATRKHEYDIPEGGEVISKKESTTTKRIRRNEYDVPEGSEGCPHTQSQKPIVAVVVSDAFGRHSAENSGSDSETLFTTTATAPSVARQKQDQTPKHEYDTPEGEEDEEIMNDRQQHVEQLPEPASKLANLAHSQAAITPPGSDTDMMKATNGQEVAPMTEDRLIRDDNHGGAFDGSAISPTQEPRSLSESIPGSPCTPSSSPDGSSGDVSGSESSSNDPFDELGEQSDKSPSPLKPLSDMSELKSRLILSEIQGKQVLSFRQVGRQLSDSAMYAQPSRSSSSSCPRDSEYLSPCDDELSSLQPISAPATPTGTSSEKMSTRWTSRHKNVARQLSLPVNKPEDGMLPVRSGYMTMSTLPSRLPAPPSTPKIKEPEELHYHCTVLRTTEEEMQYLTTKGVRKPEKVVSLRRKMLAEIVNTASAPRKKIVPQKSDRTAQFTRQLSVSTDEVSITPVAAKKVAWLLVRCVLCASTEKKKILLRHHYRARNWTFDENHFLVSS